MQYVIKFEGESMRLRSAVILSVWMLISASGFAKGWMEYDWPAQQRTEIDFLDKAAWDEESGSCASNVGNAGNVVNAQRWIVAMGRGMYGYIYGSNRAGLVERAKRMADFMLTYMTIWDAQPFFHSVVDAEGTKLFPGEENDAAGRPRTQTSTLQVYQQFYALTGLLAVYHRTGDALLLKKINKLYDAWHARFTDGKDGYFDTYNLEGTSQGTSHSFASTVYPLTAFYFSLYEAQTDCARKASILKQIQNLADLAILKLYDPETGFVHENWNSEPRPAGERPMVMVGHGFQMAWALLRLVQRDMAGDLSDYYTKTALNIIRTLMKPGFIDIDRGGVYNGVFVDAAGGFKWGENKHWWQQTYAILAITLGEIMNVVTDRATLAFRDRTVEFYDARFVDKNLGGVFAEVSEDGEKVVSDQKGNPGKFAFHATEYPQMMSLYRTIVQNSRPASGGSESRKPVEAVVYRVSLEYKESLPK